MKNRFKTKQDLDIPFIIDRTDYVPQEYIKPFTIEELIDAINNYPKEFEALATFNAGSISRTRGAK